MVQAIVFSTSFHNPITDGENLWQKANPYQRISLSRKHGNDLPSTDEIHQEYLYESLEIIGIAIHHAS